MPLTLAQLTAGQTLDEVRQQYLDALAAAGFPVTSWRSGDVARTLYEIEARALYELSRSGGVIPQIASGGLLSTATGDWLTLLAREVYALGRNPAVATKGTVRLTCSADAGPYSITPGQLWFATAAGLRFNAANATIVTLASGGTLDITVQAEAPGQAYNVANGTIATLLTPLAGVTCSNPDPGSGTWITTQGVDEEPDSALISRCQARWPESGYGSPSASYDLWARTADPTITRTNVIASAAVAGEVDVYVAGTSGPAGSPAVTAAQTYITARAPLTAVPVVVAATASAITVTATLYGKSQYQTAAMASASFALQAFFASLPIGGTVYRAAIIEALMGPTGIENVALSAPSGDATLTTSQVATLTPSLTWSNT